ncbi:unnamed protein product, partial [Cylicocyclus nassatus]
RRIADIEGISEISFLSSIHWHKSPSESPLRLSELPLIFKGETKLRPSNYWVFRPSHGRATGFSIYLHLNDDCFSLSFV